MDHPSPQTRERLHELDALRGFAALSVVFHHFSCLFPLGDRFASGSQSWTKAFEFLRRTPGSLLAAGHESVILFFVLSGFVLSLPFNKEGKPPSTVAFIVKRVFRIYVPYVIAILVAISANDFFGGPMLSMNTWFNQTWSTPIHATDVVNNILFLGNYDFAQFNTATWSLVYEMRISLLFPFLMYLLGRRRSTTVLMSIAGTLAAYLITSRLKVDPRTCITIFYTALFLVGALVAREYEGLRCTLIYSRSKGTRLLLVSAGPLIFAYSHLLYRFPIRGWFFGDCLCTISGVLLIVSATAVPSLRAVLLSRIGQFLGKVSYSLYLLHGTLLFSAIHLLYDRMPLPMILVLYVSLTLALSTLFYRLVESPAMRLGKRVSEQIMRLTHWTPLPVAPNIGPSDAKPRVAGS